MSDTTDMRVLQINLNKNQIATENALQLAVELNINIIAVQEPWLIPRQPLTLDYTNTRSIQHNGFIQIFPKFPAQHRPRTMVYASRRLQDRIKLANHSPQDPDIQILELKDGSSQIEIINIYNQDDQAGQRGSTINAYLYHHQISSRTILLGDFNLHHPLWEPESNATGPSEKLVEWIQAKGMELINNPGDGTFYRPHMERATVIDLTIASSRIASRVKDWQVMGDVGSDHFGILFTIETPSKLKD